MIAETGLAALWLAAALSLLQLFFSWAGVNQILPARGEGGVAARHAGGMPEGGTGSEAAGWAERGGGGSETRRDPAGVLPSGEPPPPGFAWSPSPQAGRISSLASAVRPIAVAQAVLVGIAFLALIQLFLRTDLSV